jgi:ABC-type glycerol-3-phosphate transport system substrate-binding protein
LNAVRVSRRRAIQQGIVFGSAAVTAGSLLAPVPEAHAATPVGNNPVITLTFNPYDWNVVEFGVETKTLVGLYEHAFRSVFEPKHPGIRVQIVPEIHSFNVGTGWTAEVIAGTAPDVFTDSRLAPYAEGNLLLPLDPYVRTANMNLSRYSGLAIDGLTMNNQLLALPTYTIVYTPIVNLDVLDAKGLSYPEPGWTWRDFTRLATQTAYSQNGQWHYGTSFMIAPGQGDAANRGTWLMRAFGGGWASADGRRCLLDSPGSLAALKWCAEELYWPKVATWYAGGGIIANNATMAIDGVYNLLADASQLRGIKWMYAPMPVWPKGVMTRGSLQWYGVSVTTKHPAAAFDLLRFVSYDRDWAELQVKMALLMPALVDLIPQWQREVEAAVPVLRSRNVHYFSELVTKGIAPARFAAHDQSAQTLIAGAYDDVFLRHQPVTPAFTTVSKRVDALESNATAVILQNERTVRLMLALANGRVVSGLPSPETTGTGLPPSPAASRVHTRGGVWTIEGDGAGVGPSFSAQDNCVLTAVADTDGVGTWTARILTLANQSCPHLSQWAQVGLMARENLSSNAAYAALSLSAGNGIVWQWRPQAGTLDQAFVPAAPPNLLSSYGLSSYQGPLGGSAWSARALTKKWLPATARENIVIRPIWIRLVRSGIGWTAQVSTDGKSWVTVAPAQDVQMLGAWVGIFVTANNGAFPKGAGLSVLASCDQLSFTPSLSVQIGQP